MATQDSVELERERHQNKLELEHEKQRTALITAAAKQKAKEANKKAKAPSVLQRETIGRASSNTKMLGDALTVMGIGAGSALWTATRPGAQSIFWALGSMGLGGIGMVESRPGTILESGSAGVLGANSAVLLLRLLNIVK